MQWQCSALQKCKCVQLLCAQAGRSPVGPWGEDMVMVILVTMVLVPMVMVFVKMVNGDVDADADGYGGWVGNRPEGP